MPSSRTVVLVTSMVTISLLSLSARAADMLEGEQPRVVRPPPRYDAPPRYHRPNAEYIEPDLPAYLPPYPAAGPYAEPPPPPYAVPPRPPAPLYATPGPGYEPEPPPCYWTRGEPVWDGYRWHRRRVRVCD